MRSFVPLPAAKAALIRQLSRQKKVRDIEHAFVMEGTHSINDLLKTQPSTILAIVVTPTFLKRSDDTLQQFIGSAAPLYLCKEREFDQLADVRTSPGILAVVRRPVWDEMRILQRPHVLGFYADCLQDPTNVGAIIRTAVAFELDALWLSPDSADVFNPKVVRSTAGALLRLPIFLIPNVLEFSRHHCLILASKRPGGASVPIGDVRMIPSRSVIALGNESRGLSATTLQEAALRFHIPVSRQVDSLNVAAAAAISAFYFRGVCPLASHEPEPNEG
ncbi:MAG TPA: RNA methyltransferase [Nitrospiraceae bacterium]|nr:RNA methyltransferase [Nitrospiraceae bacterium]